MLTGKSNQWEFQFISVSANNVKQSSHGLPTMFWEQSLSVSVLGMPIDATLPSLLEVAKMKLYEDNFFGWAVSARPVAHISRFSISSPDTIDKIPDASLLVFTLAYRVELPDNLK